MRVSYRNLFRWDALFSFLSARAIDAVESFENDHYTRGDVTITCDSNAVVITAPVGSWRVPRKLNQEM